MSGTIYSKTMRVMTPFCTLKSTSEEIHIIFEKIENVPNIFVKLSFMSTGNPSNSMRDIIGHYTALTMSKFV
jgi:hypothetical protein